MFCVLSGSGGKNLGRQILVTKVWCPQRLKTINHADIDWEGNINKSKVTEISLSLWTFFIWKKYNLANHAVYMPSIFPPQKGSESSIPSKSSYILERHILGESKPAKKTLKFEEPSDETCSSSTNTEIDMMLKGPVNKVCNQFPYNLFCLCLKGNRCI